MFTTAQRGLHESALLDGYGASAYHIQLDNLCRVGLQLPSRLEGSRHSVCNILANSRIAHNRHSRWARATDGASKRTGGLCGRLDCCESRDERAPCSLDHDLAIERPPKELSIVGQDASDLQNMFSSIFKGADKSRVTTETILYVLSKKINCLLG